MPRTTRGSSTSFTTIRKRKRNCQTLCARLLRAARGWCLRTHPEITRGAIHHRLLTAINHRPISAADRGGSRFGKQSPFSAKRVRGSRRVAALNVDSRTSSAEILSRNRATYTAVRARHLRGEFIPAAEIIAAGVRRV